MRNPGANAHARRGGDTVGHHSDGIRDADRHGYGNAVTDRHADPDEHAKRHPDAGADYDSDPDHDRDDRADGIADSGHVDLRRRARRRVPNSQDGAKGAGTA